MIWIYVIMFRDFYRTVFMIILMEEDNMKYSEIYDEKFLNKFTNKNKISEIELPEQEFSIDIDKIITLCDISIKYEKTDHSGYANHENKTITVSKNESPNRQRFTKAHELGHIILNHRDTGISYRKYGEDYGDIIESIKEREANQFAAELIMPEKIVKKAIEKSMEELNYNLDDRFNENDVDRIITEACQKMNVSKLAFQIRIKNLEIFVENV